MIKLMLKFAVKVLAISLLLLSLNFYVLEEWVGGSFGIPYYFAYFYFVSITFIIQYTWIKALIEKEGNFMKGFLAGISLKLLVSAFLLVSHLYFKDEALTGNFSVNFISLFVVYSYLGIHNIFHLRSARLNNAGD